jgi:hypothetical protein
MIWSSIQNWWSSWFGLLGWITFATSFVVWAGQVLLIFASVYFADAPT